MTKKRQVHKRVPRPRSPGWIFSERSIHLFIVEAYFVLLVYRRVAVITGELVTESWETGFPETSAVSPIPVRPPGPPFWSEVPAGSRSTTRWSVYSAVKLVSLRISRAEGLPPG